MFVNGIFRPKHTSCSCIRGKFTLLCSDKKVESNSLGVHPHIQEWFSWFLFVIPAALNSLKNFYHFLSPYHFLEFSLPFLTETSKCKTWGMLFLPSFAKESCWSQLCLLVWLQYPESTESKDIWNDFKKHWWFVCHLLSCRAYLELQLYWTLKIAQTKVRHQMPLVFSFQRIVSCCRPAANWGPCLECHRGERYSHVVDPKKEKEHEIPTVAGFVYTQQWDGHLDDIFLTYVWFLM